MKHYSTPEVVILQLEQDAVRTSDPITYGENFGFDWLNG